MRQKHRCFLTGVAYLVALVLVPCALAQKPVMSNGHPAIACTATFRGDVTWGIEQLELDGQSAFAVAVYEHTLAPSGNLGTLSISADRIAFHSPKQQEDFDESKATVQWKTAKESPWRLNVKTSHRTYKFFASASKEVGSNGWSVDGFPTCRSVLDNAFANFPAAWAQFYGSVAVLQIVRDANFHAFQPGAAAWRALPTKPPLSPETDKQWILAENALKEKNLPVATSHYLAALQAQQWMWPTGWYNLAIAVAEQNDFVGAADCMRHYLELAPDAPDAKNAREQLIIWQDKAQAQLPPQMNLVPVVQTKK